jgi:NTP pyrophosphatase (non-canonical NTP hydrolase)
MTFAELQKQQKAWADHNFGRGSGKMRVVQCLLGVVEECGELAHSMLKSIQGIRGSQQQHEAAMRDAVGDVIIYLADLCSRSGWDMQEIMEDTWEQVSARDWKRYPETGVPPKFIKE